MNDKTSTGNCESDVNTSSIPTPYPKSRRVKRTKYRRPKAITISLCHRLEAFGLRPQSKDTTDENLNNLIERLSNDLESYTLDAQFWQNKFLELNALKLQNEPPQQRTEAKQATKSRKSRISIKTGLISKEKEDELLIRLKRTVTTTLDIVNLPMPKFKANFDNFSNDEVFFSILNNLSSISSFYGTFGDDSKWGAIQALKPNFTEEHARKMWTHLFSPIDTEISKLQWEHTAGCRSDTPRSMDCFDDFDDHEDFDHMDQLLRTASDFEVADMLHYCVLLLLGVDQAIFEKLPYINARYHLEQQIRRLLREVLFSRGIFSKNDCAQYFLASIQGVIYHFSLTNKFGAIISLVEIAWSVCMQHASEVYPFMKGSFSCLSTLLASNQSNRSVWMARSNEILLSTPDCGFHLTVYVYTTSCYYAIATRDEEALMHYLAQLDMLLAAESEMTTNSLSDHLHQYPSDYLHLGLENGGLSGCASFPSTEASISPSYNVIISATATTNTAQLPSPIFDPFTLQEWQIPPAKWSNHNPPFDSNLEIKHYCRTASHIVRAEAALLNNDYPTCRYWVDEAEREIICVPDVFLCYELVDTSCLRHSFNSTCPFSSGTHSVAEEFELRILAEYERRIAQRKSNQT
jgi:hypothetical protein